MSAERRSGTDKENQAIRHLLGSIIITLASALGFKDWAQKRKSKRK